MFCQTHVHAACEGSHMRKCTFVCNLWPQKHFTRTAAGSGEGLVVLHRTFLCHVIPPATAGSPTKVVGTVERYLSMDPCSQTPESSNNHPLQKKSKPRILYRELGQEILEIIKMPCFRIRTQQLSEYFRSKASFSHVSDALRSKCQQAKHSSLTPITISDVVFGTE